MTTKWGRIRKNARQAGRDFADGAENNRQHFASLAVVDSYDEGYRERRAEQEAEREKTERLAPLQRIINRANAIFCNTDGPDSELAALIEQLAEYLLTKEESN